MRSSPFAGLNDRKAYSIKWILSHTKHKKLAALWKVALPRHTHTANETSATSPANKLHTIAIATATRTLTNLNTVKMAQSVTITAARSDITTSKPKLKLAVPFFNPNKSKKPWDGLLMGDPGSDFDQRKARLSTVEYFLEMACDSGCYTKMANWRNQPVFDDHDEFTPIVIKRVDSMMDVSEDTNGVEKWEAEKIAKEKSVWKDPSSVWRETDKAKKESHTTGFGLGYGKPW